MLARMLPATDSNWALIRRMLALTWRYRWGCVQVVLLQLVLLGLGVAALALTGLGIDSIRYQGGSDVPRPRLPFGLTLPATWSPLAVVSLIGLTVLAIALLRAALSYFH